MHRKSNKSQLQKLSNAAKRHWFFTVIISSIGVLVIVHVLFKLRTSCSFFTAEWTAGELLSYCGSIIGAIATIYVLQETITATADLQTEERNYLSKQQREDNAFSIRPYFLITADQFVPSDNDRYIELLSPMIEKKWSGDINVLVKLENVGAGNAVDVFATVYQSINEKFTVQIPVSVVGRQQTFLIRNCLDQDLYFEIEYSDIANIVKYTAKTKISIIRSGSHVGVREKNTLIEVVG